MKTLSLHCSARTRRDQLGRYHCAVRDIAGGVASGFFNEEVLSAPDSLAGAIGGSLSWGRGSG